MADTINGALFTRDSIEINHPNIILMLVNNLVSRALKSTYHHMNHYFEHLFQALERFRNSCEPKRQ